MALTAKQEKFAELVANGAEHSAAYREVYNAKRMTDKTIHEESSRLAAHPKVSARIGALRAPALVAVQESTTVDLMRTVLENARIGFMDPALLFDENDRLLPVRKMPEDVRRCLAGFDVLEYFEQGKDGKGAVGLIKKVRFHSKSNALEQLMKHFGGFEKDNEQKRDAMDDLDRAERELIAGYLRGVLAAPTRKPAVVEGAVPGGNGARTGARRK